MTQTVKIPTDAIDVETAIKIIKNISEQSEAMEEEARQILFRSHLFPLFDLVCEELGEQEAARRIKVDCGWT